MNIQIALFASLADRQPDGEGGRHPRTFEVPDGSTIADMIAMLALPNEPRIIFVNGRHADEDRVLVESDRLAIFPPIAGG